ncbi:MAG: AI-2E family transporter [Saprospiraceae bacterium]|nr:AI-2E family transporter [Saprospiraceae bacterium]MCB9328971.1 AI-2E family transporter [Lewinellaceae bacterium]
MKLNKRYIIGAIGLILIGLILYYFSDIVAYIVIAWVLSMIGAPMVEFLRPYIGKNLAALATLSVFVLLIGLIFWIFIPPLIEQAKNLSQIDYDKVGKSLDEPLKDWENWLISKGIIEKSTMDSTIVLDTLDKKNIYTKDIVIDSLVQSRLDTNALTHQLVVHVEIDAKGLENSYQNQEVAKTHHGSDFFGRIKNELYGFVNPSTVQHFFTGVFGAFSNILVSIMSILFIAFFFLREQGLFLTGIQSLLPNEREEHASMALNEISSLLKRYFIGIAIQMTIITIFVSASLSLLGIKFPLLIGFCAALLNVIPYIGPILGAAVGVFITITSGLDLSFYDELLPMIFKVLAVFAAMQLIDNFILQPNIFSKSVKAHPLEIFLVVLAAGKMGGIVGMVVAIPLYTVLRVIAKVFLSEYKVVQRLTKNI